jgi:hypothetical protein
MSVRPNKKQILIDFFSARSGALDVRDLQRGRNELRRVLGPADRTSLGYIATTLRAAGFEVRYEDPYADPAMPEPYATRLKGVLEFRDLACAEQSLLKLDALYREYREAADPLGVKFVGALVQKGRRRAQSLAANPRVEAAKRQEKQEIARWFQVWLETPDLFASWLELRKSSEEFRRFFGAQDAPCD